MSSATRLRRGDEITGDKGGSGDSLLGAEALLRGGVTAAAHDPGALRVVQTEAREAPVLSGHHEELPWRPARAAPPQDR
jgi:hypothetical protein